MGRKIAVRTRYFDDFLLDACSNNSNNNSYNKPASARRRLLAPFQRLLSLLRLRRRTQDPHPKPIINQVLILGCGMDTRAWRLPLPNATVVEVDVSPVLRAKDGVLKEVQAQRRRENRPDIPLTVRARRPVAADLADPGDDWVARVARVLDAAQPVAVVMEGLLMYLGEEDVRGLLAGVAALAAAPGSRVGISLVDWRWVFWFF